MLLFKIRVMFLFGLGFIYHLILARMEVSEGLMDLNEVEGLLEKVKANNENHPPFPGLVKLVEASNQLLAFLNEPQGDSQTVSSLDVDKYSGRWYQVYSNRLAMKTLGMDSYCVASDYAQDPHHPERMTVLNMMHSGSPLGTAGTISGFVYPPDLTNPGKLKLQLSFIPSQGDYWILKLGPESFGTNGAYEYSVISGPNFDRLFVLARDIDRFKSTHEQEVLELLQSWGFSGEQKQPLPTPQQGCVYPQDSQIAAVEGSGSGSGSLRGFIDKFVDWAENLLPKVPTVKELTVDKYIGRWYQVYASRSVLFTFEQGASCVYADYGKQQDGSISVLNVATKQGMRDAIEGYAYIPDPRAPGQLKVHFDSAPSGVDGDYWVVALGPVNEQGLYDWSIVSDPLKALLFILTRDVQKFHQQYEEEVLTKVAEMGFVRFWNTPILTEQNQCMYDAPISVVSTMSKATEGGSLQSLLRMPLHASCKVHYKFPAASCEEVQEAILQAAKTMAGFENCQSGEKCGYSTVSASSAKLELLHETPVKHYKDTVTFDLAKGSDSGCEVEAVSSSQIWYAVLDNGTNYCNIRNLVQATQLDFKETTSDNVCTQFSSADCDKF